MAHKTNRTTNGAADKHSIQHISRLLIALCIAVSASFPIFSGAQAQANAVKKGPSGLPLPRFVSLKADKVNVRKGPSTDHKVTWVYRKAGLPVEILNEYENWRQVRDSEGVEGWVFHALLSGRRTALITPWSKKEGPSPDPVPLYRSERETKSNIALLVEAGVLANILRCSDAWCKLAIGKHKGWIKQEKLWGVYRAEKIK